MIPFLLVFFLQQFAAECGLPYKEASAKDGKNVHRLFMSLARRAAYVICVIRCCKRLEEGAVAAVIHVMMQVP